MVEEVKLLIWYCYRKIAEMLKSSYWNHESQIFKTFPSFLIDELVAHVTDISETEPLKCSDLQLLIESGRVTKFILERIPKYVKASPQTTADILRQLSSACKYLTEVSILVEPSKWRRYSIVIPDFNNLLSKAQNIEFVQSNLELDLRQLRDSPKLTKMNMFFDVSNQLRRFFSVDGQLRTNNTLQYLRVYDIVDTFTASHIALILKYCSKLIYLSVKIDKALERLHAEELNSGTLTHKYNLRICELGSALELASEIAVRIASETCPCIEELYLHVGSHNAIFALRNLRNINNLHLHWDPFSHGDYTTEVLPLLEVKEFGENLTYLKLESFRNTDISSISFCCPNLEYFFLAVCNSKSTSNNILPISFPKLMTLIFEDCPSGIIKSDQLIQLLCSAHDLVTIDLGYGIPFTDHVLENVLMQNSLSNLMNFTIHRCELSLNSVKMIASTAKSLKYFGAFSAEIEDEIQPAFLEINPQVEVELLDEGISE